MTPQIEQKYFSSGPKTILYDAYYRAVTPVIANGGSLNSFLVTNGPKLKRRVCRRFGENSGRN